MWARQPGLPLRFSEAGAQGRICFFCAYVCMYIYVYIHTNTCIYLIYMYIYIYTYIYTYVIVDVCLYFYIYIYMYMSGTKLFVGTPAWTASEVLRGGRPRYDMFLLCVCVYICIYSYIYMHIVSIGLYRCTQTYINTYIHTHTHNGTVFRAMFIPFAFAL